MTHSRLLLLLTVTVVLTTNGLNATELNSEQKAWLAKGKRSERAGWIYLHVEGEANERGFQHGYLLAKEIEAGIHNTRVGWEHDTGMDWPWLVKKSTAL